MGTRLINDRAAATLNRGQGSGFEAAAVAAICRTGYLRKGSRADVTVLNAQKSCTYFTKIKKKILFLVK